MSAKVTLADSIQQISATTAGTVLMTSSLSHSVRHFFGYTHYDTLQNEVQGLADSSKQQARLNEQHAQTAKSHNILKHNDFSAMHLRSAHKEVNIAHQRYMNSPSSNNLKLLQEERDNYKTASTNFTAKHSSASSCLPSQKQKVLQPNKTKRQTSKRK